jgi:hypothetical protein
MGKIDELSPVKRQMFFVLRDGIKRLLSDDCTDEEVAHLIDKTNAESKGYFTRESFVNYDEAGKMLGIGNRTTLKATLDRHGVKMQRINNQRVGFLRSEVEALIGKDGL